MDTQAHRKRADDPSYHYWVEPATGGGCNVFCVGSAHLDPQSAAHEKRFAFDANAISAMPLNPHLKRPRSAILACAGVLLSRDLLGHALVHAAPLRLWCPVWALWFTWLCNRTGGSVVMAAVWHALFGLLTASIAGRDI